MTQLFRAAAPFVVLGTTNARRRTKPVPHCRARRRLSTCFARITTLLAIAGLAGCADTLTDTAKQPLPAPQMAVSGANVVGEYTIPTAPSSLNGTSAVPWSFTGITVPRTGKYRIRVHGAVTVIQHPTFPGLCTQQPLLTQFLGDWGPMGRPELGLFLRVGIYTQAPANTAEFGFPVREIDATTIETEQQLEASTPIWVVRRAMGAQIICPTPTSPPIPMFALSGSQRVTVTEIPGLECKGPDGNTEIVRGQTVRCTITPDKPYKVLSRRAAGTGFTIPEEPGTSHAANTQYVWEGPAVANTQVQMLIETSEEGGPKQTPHSAAFTVRARDWPKLQLAAPVVEVRLGRSLPVYPAANKALGSALAFLPQETWNTLPVTRSTQGPNAGLSFLTSPLPTVSHSIYIHPGLHRTPATPEPPHQQWYLDQDGSGEDDCTSSVFPVLRREINRHEGSTQATQSHWGVASRYYRGSEAEQRFEEVYRNGTEEELRTQARSVWSTLHGTGSEYRRLQDGFDAVDRPKVNDLLGCILDYTPGD